MLVSYSSLQRGYCKAIRPGSKQAETKHLHEDFGDSRRARILNSRLFGGSARRCREPSETPKGCLGFIALLELV